MCQRGTDPIPFPEVAVAVLPLQFRAPALSYCGYIVLRSSYEVYATLPDEVLGSVQYTVQ